MNTINLSYNSTSISISPGRRLLLQASVGAPRVDAALMLGISENTYKTIVRRILRKIGEPSLEVLSWRVRRMAAETPRHQ
jgi:hypothetical protein